MVNHASVIDGKFEGKLADKIRIAVVDDHKLFLKGFMLLVESLDDRYETTGFEAPVDFLEQLKKGDSFDLIICDLIMGSMNGLAFVGALRNHTKKLPILVLSGINSEPPIREIKKLGGNGFIHKSIENAVLSQALDALIAGKSYFPGDDGVGDMSSEAESEANSLASVTPTLPSLGARQIDVLRLIAEGATNKDISRSLEISENTVKTHLKYIFQELGVNKRTACVRKAQMMGII